MKHHFPPIMYAKAKTPANILIWQMSGKKQAHFSGHW